ncbi:MAG: hypothetical protein M1309_07640 [Actinobacteria bacterium]|nr:hypothetical protein [Actinomycetota bacterium]
MCNPELGDSLARLVQKLNSHTNELRLKYGDVYEGFREGNLDGSSLSGLNKVIHEIETDVADLETLTETS